ncbi:sugar phosphate isomerase/epimerase family protein [Pseudomonas turukhanskensis]|uniref:Xylose isomerase n=1 Tax=Pseudomonas turukhanskensis TaxID=1806536 RepID=A0A9W6NE35_9PSED|nr:sugar phosphate isomerase/epimerase [Pseudomonas turukhanskensis]GLK87342.1 xylose isomerase [Pseudomonas turukhanskensis]
MQKLEVFQSLWGMELKHPTQPERSHEENFAMAAEAGFAGICLDPNTDELPYYRETVPLFEKYGLKSMVNLFPRRMDEMQPLLEFAREVNAVKVNTIAQVMPVSVAGAIPLINRWLEQARAMGFDLLLETHRNGILNDLYFTLEVLDAIPELQLTADLSHFVVDREFPLPISARDQGFIQRIHERTDCLQGRIATAEQVQIQIGFAQHQPWVQQFQTWWKEGMASWRARNGADATCVFLCELGPPPYAITGADGLELSDRWQEALTIKRWAEALWQQLEAEPTH